MGLLPKVRCAHCGESIALDFLGMFPSPFNLNFDIWCACCRSSNQVSLLRSFFLLVLSVSLGLAGVIGLLFFIFAFLGRNRAGFWVIAASSALVIFTTFYLVFRVYFELVREPFKSPC